MRKKVLCFGDSNTFGFIPHSQGRYKENSRWSGILKQLLGETFEVIEEGCNNRTAFSDNPCGIKETGYKYLPSVLREDLDFVILALGVNDLQFSYSNSLNDFEYGIDSLIKITKSIAVNANIIILSPSCISENILNSFFSSMFDETSIEKSKHLSEIYEKIANRQHCYFIDLEKIAKTSQTDGIHYEKKEHEKIAKALYDKIIQLT